MYLRAEKKKNDKESINFKIDPFKLTHLEKRKKKKILINSASGTNFKKLSKGLTYM